MKKIISFLFVLCAFASIGQTFTPDMDVKDSLVGFNINQVITLAKQSNVSGAELRNYIKQRQRDFINQKYDTPKPNFNTPPKPNFNTKPIGGGAQIMTAPCVNEGFENTPSGAYNGAGNAYAIQGWTLYGTYATASNVNYNCASLGTPYNLGANEVSIVSTPLSFSGSNCNFVLGSSPFGGTQVLKLNDNSANYARNKIAQTFPVTQANALFQFAFAGFWENGSHSCCDQPGLYLRVINACSGGTVASCSSMTLAANCGSLANVSFTPCGGGVMSNWQTKSIDLTPYIGGCVTIEVWTADCNFGGHFGTTYFDAICGGQNISPGLGGLPGGPVPGAVSFCSGSGVATIAAPQGYNFYQWVGPNGPIAAPMGTQAVITITNPIPGQSYTVNLTSSGGCQLSSISTLNTSTIMIAGIGSSTTCPNGSSGSATVQGAGSGAGYSYTWTNNSNSVVGSSSVAVNLPAGVYSVTIAGAGNAMCGTASATVAVGVGTPQTQYLYKPYCNGQAYINTAGGSNFQWYQGNTAIQGTVGTAPGYTVTNPSSGQVYNLTYINAQNCLSQLSYTLIPSAPGSVSTTATSVCLNATNGTATIALTPAAAAPLGVYSYSIVNANTNTPVYQHSVYPTALSIYTIGGLAAGVYSVQTFDGSCMYNNLIYVNTHQFNFTMTPASATLCQGQVIAASANFGYALSGQYQFTWTPSNNLFGTNIQNNLITVNLSPGTATNIIYTVTATPTVINCPVTKTMSVLMTNPATPTFVPIPNLCTNGSNYTIQVNPNTGTFSIPNGIIVPTSTALTIGVNSFSYAYTQNSCSASNSGTFQLNQFNPSTLTSSISPICVTGNTVNLMNIVQSTVGVWSGTNVTNNVFNPANLSTNNYIFTYSTQSNPNPTVCPAFSNLTISVTNTVIPSILVNPEFCTNATSFQIVASPGGGVWTNPAVTQNGIVTPSLATTQNTLVSYTVNIGPCVNTNTFALRPSIFRSAALTGTIAHQCVTSSQVNLMNIVQSTVGVWSGTNVNNVWFNPIGLATNTYVLTYSTQSTPNNTLCPDSRTIAVSVLNPPMPNITMVGPFCSKDAAVQLTVTPNTGTWVASSFVSLNGVFNPQTAAIGNNLVQYVIGTSTCNSQQTRNISIEAFVPSTISKVVPDQCNTNGAINLNPYTLSQGVWSGAGISGNLFIPSTSGTGSIVLTHSTATSPSGLCPNSSTIAVRVYSLQAPIITTVTQICNLGNPFKLQVVPIGGIFGGVNNNAITYNGIYNPALGIIGSNIINYSITAGPCVAIAQTTIDVVQFKSADLAVMPKEYYCIGSEQPFNLNSFVQNTGGVWSGPGVLGTMFHPELANVGNNILTYQIQNWLCPDTKTVNIKTSKVIQPTVSVVNNIGCAPVQAIFVANTNLGKGEWLFGDGTKFTGLNAAHVFTAPGTYTACFSYVSNEGCVAPNQTITSIEVYEQPKPDFTVPKEVYITDSKIQATNKTSNVGNYTYVWNVSNTVSVNSVNLTFDTPKIGYYEITLTAKSVKGCAASITKTVEVKNEFNVYLPNTFTPNEDGLNDYFKPVFSDYGISSECYRLEVYDRWGQLLFTTFDINKGWDGKVKGEVCKDGVYVYKIRFCDIEKTMYNQIGHVTLLK